MRALQRGELETAVVGAVDLAGDLRSVATAAELRALAGADQTGAFAPADGAVALVLKRLVDAEAAGDRVYAVVRGLGSAGGGALGKIDAGVCHGALARAYADAGVDADGVGYVETAGGAPPEAAAAEQAALAEFFHTAGGADIAVSDTAASLGHAGAATGLLGVAKAALCLQQAVLPPGAADSQPASNLPAGDGAPLFSPRTAEPWLRDRQRGPRRAGVSAAALDGTATHVVLEAVETPAPSAEVELRQPLGARDAALFAVWGETPSALADRLDDLAKFADEASGGIEYLARRWHARAAGNAENGRLAVAMVARDRAGLRHSAGFAAQALRLAPHAALDGVEGVYYTPQPLAETGELALVFPGSGNHFIGMGRRLGLEFPEVLRALDAETGTLASQVMPQWFMPHRAAYHPGWEQDAARQLAAHPLAMIMGQVAVGAQMADVLRFLGAEPTAAIGYSLGETTSLFALRAWRDRDEMLRRMQVSTLFASDLAGSCDAARAAWRLTAGESVDWCVMVLNRPADEVRQAVLRSERVYLLIVNAPHECVIGGRRGAVEDIIITLGCEAVELVGASTVHCSIVRETQEAYRALHLLDTTPPAGVRFYSAAGGAAYDVTRESAADSILRQALHGFDFTRVVEQAYADGVRLFVETGPGASCTRMIGKILSGRPMFAGSACAPSENAVGRLLHLLAGLIAHGAVRDLAPLYGHETRAVGHAAPRENDERRVVAVSTGYAPPTIELPWPSNRSVPMHAADTSPAAEPAVPSTPAPGVPTPADCGEPSLAEDVATAGGATAAAHDAYLRFAQSAMSGMGETLTLQARVLDAVAARGGPLPPASAASIESATPAAPPAAHATVAHTTAATPSRPSTAPVYPRELCMEFAIGSVAKVLGPEFAEVDTYPARVRLPDEPLMLVDRILSVTGEKGSLTSGSVVTEHDVLPGDWYLDGGAMPISITVESGQADLFLCAYLGIDLRVKGARVYRLLDATIAFHRRLPRPGVTVRYDIRIDRFVRQGDTYLFFFEFDGTIDGVSVLTMRNGCAGFFTDAEIRESGGIVETPAERAPDRRNLPPDWRNLAPMHQEAYDDAQVDALRRGDLAACFGKAFDGLKLRDPLRLPGGRLRLVDRVAAIEPDGGRYGLGMIRAEADIHPDDWFLTCHFVDDMVMPGTLMYECCAHTLRIFLMRMGWVAEHDAVCFEPVIGVQSALRCRGPVTVDTKQVTYEVHVKELGYGPEPYCIADALMFGDGEKIVRFTDMSLKMSGVTREMVDGLWTRAAPSQDASAPPLVTPIGEAPVPADPRPAVYGYEKIYAFARGKPSEAFGAPYRVFDDERRIARLPGPPYQVLDRITRTEARAWELKAEGWIEGQYDVPPDAWYFAANRQRSMPFAVLLEIALQPCGWLAAYKGSALASDTDLSFRNLGGTAVQHAEVFPDAGTLTTRVRLTEVSRAGGMIIEKFDMQVWSGGRYVYSGDTTFGFFSAAALAQQVGIRDAHERLYLPTRAELARAQTQVFELDTPVTPEEADGLAIEGPDRLALPAKAWRMIDAVECFVPDGGPHGLGYLRGVKTVDPDEWFFAAHFYQDPVCPGSLGLESLLQLLKVAARHRWGVDHAATHRFTPMVLGEPHTWIYRGQVIPKNRLVTVEAVVTEVREDATPTIRAHGFLKVDGVIIYEMRDFGLSLAPV